MPLTEAEELELLELEEAESMSSPQVMDVPRLSPAQEYQSQHPFMRTAGRAGRNLLSGAASLADVALLVPKTLASGGEFVAEKAGLEGTPLERGLQKIRSTPSMHDATQGIVDQATGNKLKPTGLADSAFDFLSEMAVPTSVYGKTTSSVNKAPGIIDAVSGVLNPGGSIAKFSAKKYNAPTLPDAEINRLSADELRKKSSATYQEAAQRGGTLRPEFTDKWLDSLGDIKFTDELVSSMRASKDKATDILDDLQVFRGKEMTLQRAQDLDELLGNAATYEMGRPTKEGLRIIKMQQSFRNSIDDALDEDIVGGKEGFAALKQARSMWRRSVKLRDIERIVERAEMTDNPATSIKSGFRTIASNPNNLKGYTKAEREAIKKAAVTGYTQDLLKTFGSRLIPIISTSTGGPGVGTAASYIAPAVSRGLAEKMQMNKAEKVMDLIAETPKRLPNPVGPFQKTTAGVAANIVARQGK